MDSLQAKLKELGERVMGTGRMENGSETPQQETVQWGEGTEGASVDWSDYDVPAEKLVAYRRAKFTNGEWLCPYTFFNVISHPVSKMSDHLEILINSSDGWRLTSLQPHGSGMITAMLTRSVSYRLPTPSRLAPAAETDADINETIGDVEAWAENNRGEGVTT